jgi:hypothetical protein
MSRIVARMSRGALWRRRETQAGGVIRSVPGSHAGDDIAFTRGAHAVVAGRLGRVHARLACASGAAGGPVAQRGGRAALTRQFTTTYRSDSGRKGVRIWKLRAAASMSTGCDPDRPSSPDHPEGAEMPKHPYIAVLAFLGVVACGGDREARETADDLTARPDGAM